MRVIGITGGVGSGKSRVLSYLEKNYGAAVCRLDDVAKRLQKKDGKCYARILQEFGRSILDAEGEIDREKLAGIVFFDKDKRKLLNGIVHPLVKQWVKNDIEKKRQEGFSLYALEAAILLEAGYEDICPQIWYIYASQDVRRKRLKQTRGYSDEKISRMMAAQATEEIYKKFCSAILDNNGDFKDTERQIGEYL